MAAIVDKNGMCLAHVAAAQTHIRRRTKTANRRWRACCGEINRRRRLPQEGARSGDRFGHGAGGGDPGGTLLDKTM